MRLSDHMSLGQKSQMRFSYQLPMATVRLSIKDGNVEGVFIRNQEKERVGIVIFPPATSFLH